MREVPHRQRQLDDLIAILLRMGRFDKELCHGNPFLLFGS
jgi:hypothetical protein